MTRQHKDAFTSSLKDALKTFPKHSPLRQMIELFELEGDLGGRLAEWTTTPTGRAFLRERINSEEGRAWLGISADSQSPELARREVRESDLHRWAFVAELICFGFAKEKAASYVDHGLTLRDIKSRSVEELAERRWALMAQSESWIDLTKRWEDEETAAELVAEIIEVGSLEKVVLKDFLLAMWSLERITRGLRNKRIELERGEQEFEFFERKFSVEEIDSSSISSIAQTLAGDVMGGRDTPQVLPDKYEDELVPESLSLESEWMEAKTKDWLKDQYGQWKHRIEHDELEQLGISDQEISALLELGIVQTNIKLTPDTELTDQLYIGELTEDGIPLLSFAELAGEMMARIRAIRQDQDQITFNAAIENAAHFVFPKQSEAYRGIPFDYAILMNLQNEEVIKSLSSIGQMLRDIEEYKIQRAIQSLIKSGLTQEFRRLKGEIEQVEKIGGAPFHVGFYDLLILSDFHMAAGDQPSPEGITRLSPTEDFFYDDTFFRFVHYIEMERQKRKGHAFELVFNGDLIDFAQLVVPIVQSREPLTPWPLPSLLDEVDMSAIQHPDNGREDIAPVSKRLFRILYSVYGEDDINDAIARHIRALNPTGQSNRGRFLANLLDRTREAALGDLPRARWDEGMNLEEWIGEGQGIWNKDRELEIQQMASGSFVEKAKWETTETWAQEYWNDSTDAERQERDMKNLSVMAMERGEALDQLADSYRGHRNFFQGLAWFLAQGNRAIILRGNHDPQWYWPEVQLAFVGWLKNAYTDLLRAVNDPASQELPVLGDELRKWLPTMSLEDFERQVDFNHSWYYYRDRLAYIEHGGQQEAVDSHRYFLVPSYTNDEVANSYLRPQDVGKGVASNVLDFLNQAQSAKEIASAIDIPDERDVGTGVARRIINERDKLAGFTTLREVRDVPQVGPERFTEIVTSLGKIPSRNLDAEDAQSWLPMLQVSPHEGEIEPPIGSLGNIFFINNVEIQFPNIDRPGYETSYLRYLTYGDPKLVLYFLNALWKTAKAMTEWAMLPISNWRKWAWRRLSERKSPFAGFTKWRGKQHKTKLDDYARLTGFPRACVEELDRTKWVGRWRLPAFSQFFVIFEAVLFVIPIFVLLVALYGSFREGLGFDIQLFDALLEWTELPQALLLKIGIDLSEVNQPFWLRTVTSFLWGFLAYWGVQLIRNAIGLGEDFLYEPAQRVSMILVKYNRSVPYLLFGHDHVRNAQRLRTGPWYLNTGAWMHKFGKDRSRLLREPLEYPFVRMIDTHRVLASNLDDYMTPRAEARPIVDLLRWNDEGGWVEECETFEGLEEANIPNELELARQYEPVLSFSTDGNGDKESFFPVGAGYYVSKCGLRRRNAGWVFEPGKVRIDKLGRVPDPRDCYLVYAAQDSDIPFELLDEGLELFNASTAGRVPGIDAGAGDGAGRMVPRLLVGESELDTLRVESPAFSNFEQDELVVTKIDGRGNKPLDQQVVDANGMVSVIPTGLFNLPQAFRDKALENYAPRSHENWKNHPPVYHYHISKDGPFTVLQYWFFYAYNDWASHGGANDHEGDWEVVYVFLDDRGRPQRVASSRHYKIPLLYEPDSMPWAAVERVKKTHPVVYVGCGSHASYLEKGTHKILGLDDFAKGDDRSIGPDTEQPWGKPIRLSSKGWNTVFSGNWGALVKRWSEVVLPGTSGPVGPAHQGKKWEHPAEWTRLI